jgi:hypothetical protein
MIREHSHPSVCVEADLFWPEDYEPLTDDDGYCQPDGHMDASPHHSANAVLIVSAVNALPALLDEVEALRAALSAEGVGDGEIEAIRERHRHLSLQLKERSTDMAYHEGRIAHADRATLLRKVDELTRAAKET